MSTSEDLSYLAENSPLRIRSETEAKQALLEINVEIKDAQEAEEQKGAVVKTIA